MKAVSVYQQAETPLTKRHAVRLGITLIGTIVALIGLSLLVRTLLPPETQALSTAHLTWLETHTSAEMTRDMNMIAYLGSSSFVVGILCVVAGVHMWRQQWYGMTFALASLVGAVTVAALTKLLFDSHVDNLVAHITQETAYAYPSSYGILPAVLVSSLAVLAWHTKWRWYTIGLGVVYILAVAAARMYLGGYYPASLILGWGIGLTLTLAVAWALTRKDAQVAPRNKVVKTAGSVDVATN